MEDHGNLDGSTGYILESACSHVGANVITGAIIGGLSGAKEFNLKNGKNAASQNAPEKFYQRVMCHNKQKIWLIK